MPRIAPVPYRTIVRVLEYEGFILTRQRGDHMIFTKAGICGLWWFRATIRFLSSSSRTHCGQHSSAASGTSSFLEHMPVAEEEVHVVLFEPRTTLNTGNVRNERTLEQLQRV